MLVRLEAEARLFVRCGHSATVLLFATIRLVSKLSQLGAYLLSACAMCALCGGPAIAVLCIALWPSRVEVQSSLRPGLVPLQHVVVLDVPSGIHQNRGAVDSQIHGWVITLHPRGASIAFVHADNECLMTVRDSHIEAQALLGDLLAVRHVVKRDVGLVTCCRLRVDVGGSGLGGQDGRTDAKHQNHRHELGHP